MPSSAHGQAWEDWGDVDPLFAILTEPQYRHGGGDVDQFLKGGEGAVAELLLETEQLGIGKGRGTALDFGCGVGRLTGGLANAFDEALGVDVAPSMLTKARELHAARTNVTFAVNQANDLRWLPDAVLRFRPEPPRPPAPGLDGVHQVLPR